ncbi:MAG: hypothetical protein ACI4KM_03095 [Oscillospiraceae bacterium]
MNGFSCGEDAIVPGAADIIKDRAEGYKITNALITTYTFESKELNRIINKLAECNIISVKNLPELTVYYHAMTGDCDRYFDSDCFIQVGDKTQSKSFHPKIILLRLEKSSDDTKYLLLAASRNITGSDFLEAYAVLEGTASANDNKNGKTLVDYITQFTKVCSLPQVPNWLKDVADVNFTVKSDSSVEKADFVTAQNLAGELKKLNNIIAVSPFLGDVIHSFDIRKILTTTDAIISLKRKYRRFKPLISGKKFGCKAKIKLDLKKIREIHIPEYLVLNDDVDEDEKIELHAKIYCGLDKDKKTVLIIGSSNATYRGGLWCTGSVNYEFNVMLTFSDSKMHGEFGEIIKAIGCEPDLSSSAASAKTNNNMDKFFEIFRNLIISEIDAKRAVFEYSGEQKGFSVNGVEVTNENKGKIEVPLKNFFSVCVTVESSSFYIDLLQLCKEDIREKLKPLQEKSLNANLIRLSEQHIENIISGKKRSKDSDDSSDERKSAESKTRASSRFAVSRECIYEKLMKMSKELQPSGIAAAREAFIEKIRQINSMAISGSEWETATNELLAKYNANGSNNGGTK